jgi:hypothetical protein
MAHDTAGGFSRDLAQLIQDQIDEQRARARDALGRSGAALGLLAVAAVSATLALAATQTAFTRALDRRMRPPRGEVLLAVMEAGACAGLVWVAWDQLRAAADTTGEAVRDVLGPPSDGNQAREADSGSGQER